MPTGSLALVTDPRGTILAVRVRPQARQAGILGVHDGALRVGVTVPPEQGKANAAVASLLAAALGCRLAEVTLISGPTHRSKRFLIFGLDLAAVTERLRPHLDRN